MSPPVQPPGSPSGTFVRQVPEGDNRERLVCGDCGFVQYENLNARQIDGLLLHVIEQTAGCGH